MHGVCCFLLLFSNQCNIIYRSKYCTFRYIKSIALRTCRVSLQWADLCYIIWQHFYIISHHLSPSTSREFSHIDEIMINSYTYIRIKVKQVIYPLWCYHDQYIYLITEHNLYFAFSRLPKYGNFIWENWRIEYVLNGLSTNYAFLATFCLKNIISLIGMNR